MKKYIKEIENLNDLERYVTQENGTEQPYNNEYYNEFRDGIYIDKISKEVLFTSLDKFDSGCGWPSFTQPVDEQKVKELSDTSHGMRRTEVRSTESDSHLGHVFNDGPNGKLRYCINSASLTFIPVDKLEESGYSEYLKYFVKNTKR